MFGTLTAYHITLASQYLTSKPGKAVSKGSAPAAAWKLCAQPISQALSRYCASLNTQQPLDDDLTRADLCLIPKPGKPADKPSQLRPLGILPPDAKGLAGTAKESRSSWSRSLCPTCGLCPSSLISQDAAFLMRRVGSYSIYGKFGNSVARRAPVGSSCSGDMVQPIW